MFDFVDIFTNNLVFFADTAGAIKTVRDYVLPTAKILSSIASLACAFFLAHAGYIYMTSSGKPDRMEHAKSIAKKAVTGLVIVLAAVTIVSILNGSYQAVRNPNDANLPNLQAVTPKSENNGLIEMIIKAVTGLLSSIINAIASPFLNALEFFTKSTPLMASNKAVFNLWLAIVGIADVLLILIVALVGFQVMSASSFGFDEVEVKHLLPRIALIFLLMNTSIFLIDGIISLSNVLISAVNQVSGASTVWSTLIKVVEKTSGQGVAALLIMVAFLICSIILLVYYVMRLITLFIGTVLSPLVSMLWLVPGFRDFAETSMKTFLSTIFVLFVHVVILQLASSLFSGMATTGNNAIPDTLMAMVAGIATILTLLKVQGVMMQFSFVSMGARNLKKLGGQFMNGVIYMTGTGSKVAHKTTQRVKNTTHAAKKARVHSTLETVARQTKSPMKVSYLNKKGDAEITYSVNPRSKNSPTVVNIPESKPLKTGTTYRAGSKIKSTKQRGKES
ncbi:pilin [Candidatus Saccharibacteria bacterium oral taxon 955]